jgi:hypothetical protein
MAILGGITRQSVAERKIPAPTPKPVLINAAKRISTAIATIWKRLSAISAA